MERFREALMLGIGHLFSDTPYIILIFAALYDYKRVSKHTIIKIILTLAILRSCGSFFLVLLLPNWKSLTPIQYFITVIILLVVCKTIFHISLPKYLFTFFILRTCSSIANYIPLNIFMLMRQGKYIGIENNLFYTLSIFLMTLILYPLYWRFFRRSLPYIYNDIDEKNAWFLCAAPALFYTLDQLYSLIRDTLEYNTIQTSVIFLFILLTGLITYYVNLNMLQKAVVNARYLEKMSIMDEQLKIQSDRFVEITNYITEIKILKHDMRHHLQILEGILSRNEYEKASQYLKEYSNSINDSIEKTISNNFVADIIIRRYEAMARDNEIDFQVSIKLPNKSGISDTDLCIILGNLVENAMNACILQKSGDKFINIKIKSEDNQVLIAVDNSFNILSEDEKKSCFGKISVEIIAKKYGGSTLFNHEKGVYMASVLLYKNYAQKN